MDGDDDFIVSDDCDTTATNANYIINNVSVSTFSFNCVHSSTSMCYRATRIGVEIVHLTQY